MFNKILDGKVMFLDDVFMSDDFKDCVGKLL